MDIQNEHKRIIDYTLSHFEKGTPLVVPSYHFKQYVYVYLIIILYDYFVLRRRRCLINVSLCIILKYRSECLAKIGIIDVLMEIEHILVKIWHIKMSDMQFWYYWQHKLYKHFVKVVKRIAAAGKIQFKNCFLDLVWNKTLDRPEWCQWINQVLRSFIWLWMLIHS